MTDSGDRQLLPLEQVYTRALDARDPRFDGVFFVGITTTRIYCRPICPARVSYPDRRRFFTSAAAAERAGYRPCLRCRPELAPGRATTDALPRLARVAARRIAAGALNGRTVAELAHDLGVSERHVRRALEREVGVGPVELALTHRLLLAKRLLVDTRLSVTRIAFASGFQSLRRFNAVFRERYRMSPGDLRRAGQRNEVKPRARTESVERTDLVHLTLAYRPPLAWSALLALLRRDSVRGVDMVEGSRFFTTVRLDGHAGIAIVDRDALDANGSRVPRPHLNVALSPELLPVLMPLISRLRHLFDLDAEPAVIDAHLETSGLRDLVHERPGLRVPGAIDGFDVALRVLLRRAASSPESASDLVSRVVHVLGDAVTTDVPGLSRLAPEPRRVVDAGAGGLVALGVAERQARCLAAIATAVAERRLTLEPGIDPAATLRELCSIGVDEDDASGIVMRALGWPDACPAMDGSTSCAACGPALVSGAERWRPWRAYAIMHLRLHEAEMHRAASACAC